MKGLVGQLDSPYVERSIDRVVKLASWGAGGLAPRRGDPRMLPIFKWVFRHSNTPRGAADCGRLIMGKDTCRV